MNFLNPKVPKKGIQIYFLLSHPGQGTHVQQVDGNLWEVGVMGQLLREGLQGCRGYPSYNEMQCPAFLQDKWNYLVPLMEKDMASKTLKLDRTIDGLLSEDVKSRIWEYEY